MSAVAQPWQAAAARVAGGALGWVHRHRLRGAFPSDESLVLADPNADYKPLAEMALMAGLLHRYPGALPGDGEKALELREFCWSQLRAGDLLYERQLRHPLLTDPLEVYALFAAAGHRHTRLDELLNHLLATDSYAAVEQQPNRRLAVANAALLAGLRNDDADVAALSAATATATGSVPTWLSRLPEPWLIDWDTAYAMTHTVFHLTDWGMRPHRLGNGIADYLRQWLPVWMEVWAETCEWDLLAELLMVDACLPEPQHPEEMWETLARAQHADGLVPYNAKGVTADPDQAFRDHQHPTCVATAAGVIALGRSSG
ncbi:hypothetical protein G5C51_00665 [Streptomyces sp. A7024]|uniref:DUF6895 domain-containing protein n=1 Tax=Streptomyces coryli TaxID=1128680 RepID=A0A6G4TR07_9ACTN|nr:hypothetical protein [Streptomyces coryli]NGN62425.1 hypothetical protein [Streptomyces coryli]